MWAEDGIKAREVKGKREKERYTHLTAEFQRIARRDKEAFLNDQYKEVEENIQLYLCDLVLSKIS